MILSLSLVFNNEIMAYGSFGASLHRLAYRRLYKTHPGFLGPLFTLLTYFYLYEMNVMVAPFT
jgi:hypothetical protein